MIAKAGRFWRTVRHLRPVQFYGRLWFRLYRPRPDMAPPPTLRGRQGIWHAPAERAASLVGPTRFRFLNAEADLTKIGWDHPEQAKLWRYNQHYFDDLNAEGGQARANWHRALIDAWITDNPPGKGTGWEPYPTSLRIVNWVKWSLAGNSPDPAANHSLAVQARWLMRRMEYHLLGNHLFANAKALVFAGLYFEENEAQTWLERGLEILTREIPEQVLPDGGQFELSPMYHALAVEDMLDLVNIAQAYGRRDLAANWRARLPAMLRWMRAMSHPDDSIAFFNDAAMGIAPDNAELRDYADRLGFSAIEPLPPLTKLENSGYVRMEAGSFVLLADMARIGPDYLPGHAHADTLSFELSYAGHRVFVNSGTSEYGTGPERLRQRGTAAHNTVIVEGRNSSEVWSGFRVGRRARPRAVSNGAGERGGLHTRATHDGYRYLPGQPLVSRRFELDEKRLLVADTVTTNAQAEGRFHLHPLVSVKSMTSDCVMLALPGGQQLRLQCDGDPLRLEDSTWHPEFGVSVPNRCIVLPLAAGNASLSVERG